MIRLASMSIPLLAIALGPVQAGDAGARAGRPHDPAMRDAWYSTTCCYKKIIRHVTVAEAVWVKVPPHRHRRDDDDAEPVHSARPAHVGRPERPAHRAPPVVALGEVFRLDDGCHRAVRARRDRASVIVLVSVACR